MDRDQIYPDPDTTQAGAGGPPFYGHAAGEHSEQSEQMTGFRSEVTSQLIDEQLQRALASRTTHATHNTSQLIDSPLQGASVGHHQHEQNIANALTMSNPDQYAANAHQSPDSGDGSHKRTKVSRACDECRRKKIRCDAQNENGPEACSNCKKSSNRCTFSRQPMKRGPSKGYIKELSDRLVSLENSIQTTPGQVSHIPRITQQVVQLLGLGGPEALHEQSSLATGVAGGQKRSHSEMLDAHHQPLLGQGPSGLPATWNDGHVNVYYANVHVYLPFLPHDKLELEKRVRQASAKLAEAFTMALDAAVCAYPGTGFTSDENMQHSHIKVGNLLSAVEFEDQPAGILTVGIVYIQSCLLMALGCEGRDWTLQKSTWLSRAVTLAVQLKLHTIVLTEAETQVDEDRSIARRVLWSLFTIDRWHAVSTMGQFQLSETYVNLLSSDHALLTIEAYRLARMTFVVGQISMIISSMPTATEDTLSAYSALRTPIYLIYMSLNRQVQITEADMASVDSNKSIFTTLIVLHVRILISSLHPNPKHSDILDHAMRMAFLLAQQLTDFTPLNRHFIHLVVSVIGGYATSADTNLRDSVHRALDDIDYALSQGRILHTTHEWNAHIRNTIAAKKAAPVQAVSEAGVLGLQDLASAAVANGDQPDQQQATAGAEQDNVMALVRSGYLNIL